MALIASYTEKAELYGRLHQIIELFQAGRLSSTVYSELHEKITNQISEVNKEEPTHE
jgi:hypothetical protein